MTKYLCTGGCGFIGSHLVTKLVELGHDVVVIDDMSSGSADLKNLESVKDKVEIVVGTIANYALLKHLATGVDNILHLATQCLVMGMDNPSILHEANAIGSFNVCLAAKENNAQITFISTSEVYGIQEKFPIKEDAPLKPISLYALTKVIGENYVKFFHETYNVPAVIIRPFNAFGPLQREDLNMERLLKGFNAYAGVITSFIKRLERNEAPVIFGDGLQSRDFSYVSDTVDGILLLLKLSNCEVVNLGSGTDVSVTDLAYILEDVWGADHKPPIYGVPRINDINRLLADISVARSYSYHPKVSLRKGLENYAEWYKGVRDRAT